MRLGTQTSIQASTAIPLIEDPENEEESAGQDNVARLSEDGDDDKLGASLWGSFSGLANQVNHIIPIDHRMASSIHAIHRPFPCSQQRERASEDKNRIPEVFASDTEEEEGQYPTTSSGEEDDFDPLTIPIDLSTWPKSTPSIPASQLIDARFGATGKIKMIRSLVNKLRDVFELEGIQQVVAGQHCSPPHFHVTRCTDHILLRNPMLAAAVSAYVVSARMPRPG